MSKIENISEFEENLTENKLTDEQQKELEDCVSSAKIYLLMKYPYIGSISTKLIFEYDYSLPTAATDGKRIYINPNFFYNNLSKGEIIFVVSHEILHVLYDHIFRRGNRDPIIWNHAIDYIVNYTLIKNKIGIAPSNILFNEKYSDEYSSEELYDLLIKNNYLPSSQLGVQFDIHLDGPDDGPSQNGDVNPGISISKSEIDSIRNEIKAVLNNIANEIKKYNKGAGNLPAGIERLIKNINEPKINWRDYIVSRLLSMIKTDYNFMKPSNQSWSSNYLIPSMTCSERSRIAVFIDCSGSISDKELGCFFGELINISCSFEYISILVASFDTKIYNPQEYDEYNIDEIKNYKTKGGGGTSYEKIFSFIKEKENDFDSKFDNIIIFTDGYPNNNNWGDPDFEYKDKTIFLITNKKIKSPYGITIYYD